MDLEINHRMLTQLTRIILGYSNLYILGAGTSASYVPIGPKLLQLPCESYWQTGSFPIIPVKHDERSKRILSHMDKHLTNDETTMYKYAMQTMPMSYVEIHLSNTIATPRNYLLSDNLCKEEIFDEFINYSVFSYFPKSIIVDYNLDGLSSELCTNRHYVLTPHGLIDHKLGCPSIKELLKRESEFENDVVEAPYILLVKENYKFLSNKYFNLILNKYAYCKAIIIIGYSFGKNENNFDDLYSLKFFCNLLKTKPKPVYVIDPFTSFIRNYIEEEVKSKNIYYLPIYWDIYSRAVNFLKKNLLNIEKITDIYHKIA